MLKSWHCCGCRAYGCMRLIRLHYFYYYLDHCIFLDFPESALECYSDERRLYSGEQVMVKDILKLTCRYWAPFTCFFLSLYATIF